MQVIRGYLLGLCSSRDLPPGNAEFAPRAPEGIGPVLRDEDQNLGHLQWKMAHLQTCSIPAHVSYSHQAGGKGVSLPL